MERILIESAVRALLLAIAVHAVLQVARIHTAAGRHAAWTIVMVAMIAMPLWLLAGPKMPLPVSQPSEIRVWAPAPDGNGMAATVGARRTSVAASAVAGPPSPPVWPLRWQALALGIYALGVALLLGRLGLGTVRARRVLENSVLVRGHWTSARCAAPVTVGWFRPVAILPEGWDTWPERQLEMALIHEQQHARRRDPLIQWLALLNRAVFWFHPLAWWLERRLARLSEEACDAAVLSRGYQPADYAESLLTLARSVVRAGARVHVTASAMAGTFLSRRLSRILHGAPEPPLSRSRVACAFVACVTCSVALSAATIASTQARLEQSPAAAGARLSEYWLDDDEWHLEVDAILTSEELDAYRRLTTTAQRDAFIEDFWKRRDPTPGTDTNEFRDEFVRRIAHAKEHFANPQSLATFGYQTDRGRWHVRFGAPDSVVPGRWSSEEWRYESLTELGSNVIVQFDVTSSVFSCTYRGGRYRILSPAAGRRFEGTTTAPDRTRRALALTFPNQFVYLSFPIDAAAVAMRWGLRGVGAGETAAGEARGRIDYVQGDIAWSADKPASSQPPILEHLSGLRFFEPGHIACTEQLPVDTYTLWVESRLQDGTLRSDTVTFEIS